MWSPDCPGRIAHLAFLHPGLPLENCGQMKLVGVLDCFVGSRLKLLESGSVVLVKIAYANSPFDRRLVSEVWKKKMNNFLMPWKIQPQISGFRL